MGENSRAASAQIEADSLDRAEIESRLRQEVAELKANRERSPDVLQNSEALQEHLLETARELKKLQAEVAEMRRERTSLKSTIDRLRNDLTESRTEVTSLRSELAEWSEQYQFQFAKSERPERRAHEPKLRSNEPPRESRGERSSPGVAAPRGNGDDEEDGTRPEGRKPRQFGVNPTSRCSRPPGL